MQEVVANRNSRETLACQARAPGIGRSRSAVGGLSRPGRDLKAHSPSASHPGPCWVATRSGLVPPSRFPEHPPENRVDVLQMIAEVELLLDLSVAEISLHVRVFL